MALDQYSLCPCGNGKKIKFCKCHEHYSEIEKLDRMIQGEQYVAALDHVNQLLKSIPSEPWLLAMKCEVLLKLNEIEPLEEASAKFIRLQPDNPLAKMYRSLVAVVRGNAEEGCSLLLQGLAATNGPLHPFFLTAMINLIELLINSRRFLTAMMHAEILLSIAEGFEQAEKLATEMYSTLSTDDRVSILQREVPPSPPEADDQPYAERYREALALLAKTHITQSKTKLDGIIREFGPQAPLLSARLHCQLMIADTDGAAETCLRLAKTESLSVAQKVYYQALAFELAPKKSGAAVDMELAVYELSDEAEIEAKLISNARLVPVKSEMMRDMFKAITSEEVPPKATYVLAVPVLGDEFAQSRPKASGQWIALMGKQTDKPARLFALEPKIGYQAEWFKQLIQDVGLANAKREISATLPSSVLAFFDATVQVDQRPGPNQHASFSKAIRELDRQNFLNFPVPMFNGGTPKSVASQSQYHTELLALLLFWQASGKSKLESTDFVALHQELGLEAPKVDPADDTFDLVGGASYFWTDLSKIDEKGLLQLAQSALTRGVHSVMSGLADRIEEVKWPDELYISADYTKLSLQARVERDLEKAEKILFQLVEKGRVLKFTIGNAVLERCRILHSLNRETEATEYLIKIFTECPDDPAIQQYANMMSMREAEANRGSRGGGDLDDALLGRGAAGKAPTPASSSSKLWTPDQGPEDVGQGSSGGSGSGLWVPGQ
jgi:tetratricopeptide (TPR) repeat protein